MTSPAWKTPPAAPGIDVSKLTRLPCGCLMGADGMILVYVPCSKSCTYYQYLLTMSAEESKPVIKIGSEDDLPD